MVTPFGSMVEEPGITVTDVPLITKVPLVEVDVGDVGINGILPIVVGPVG